MEIDDQGFIDEDDIDTEPLPFNSEDASFVDDVHPHVEDPSVAVKFGIPVPKVFKEFFSGHKKSSNFETEAGEIEEVLCINKTTEGNSTLTNGAETTLNSDLSGNHNSLSSINEESSKKLRPTFSS